MLKRNVRYNSSNQVYIDDDTTNEPSLNYAVSPMG
jgi:hypothetical protein